MMRPAGMRLNLTRPSGATCSGVSRHATETFRKHAKVCGQHARCLSGRRAVVFCSSDTGMAAEPKLVAQTELEPGLGRGLEIEPSHSSADESKVDLEEVGFVAVDSTDLELELPGGGASNVVDVPETFAGASLEDLDGRDVHSDGRILDAVENEQGSEKFQGSLRGLLFLNLGAALFGSNQVVIKTAERAMSPGALSAIRFGIATMVFAPSILKGLKNKELRSAALELSFWLFGGYGAQAMGLVTTTAARGAFTGTFTVLAVPILVGLSGRRVSLTTWIAAGVALSGVGLLTTSGVDPNVGDLWCILSAILFGVHKWRSESITSRFSQDTNELVAVQIGSLAALSAICCLPEFLTAVQTTGIHGLMNDAMNLPWMSLSFMGLGTTALTLFLEMESLKEVSAPMAALIYTAEPLWGALFAYMFLDERWGPTGWVGAVLIIASSLFPQLIGDNTEKATGEEEIVTGPSEGSRKNYMTLEPAKVKAD